MSGFSVNANNLYGKFLGEQRETSGNASLQQVGEWPKEIAPGEAFPPRFLMQGDQACVQQLIDLVHFLNKKWWQDPKTGEPIERNFGELLMLAVSELAEALEADRKT